MIRPTGRSLLEELNGNINITININIDININVNINININENICPKWCSPTLGRRYVLHQWSATAPRDIYLQETPALYQQPTLLLMFWALLVVYICDTISQAPGSGQPSLPNWHYVGKQHRSL